jgi:hypothetical protein
MTNESNEVGTSEALDLLNVLASEIPAIEQAGENYLCQELPIVVKHLTTVRTSLQAKGVHPIKVWFLGWGINLFNSAIKALNCPVPTVTPITATPTTNETTKA